MKIESRVFGVLADGREVSLFTVSNGAMSFSAADYGATLTSIRLPSDEGGVEILLGYDTLSGYAADTFWHGALVGRFANRIAHARFPLGGKEYELTANEGEHCLHSGLPKYSKCLWQAQIVERAEGAGISFSRVSPSGEQGFPGRVEFEVLYLLSDHNELTLRYRGESTADTPVSLTNHAYFNLSGRADVRSHSARIISDAVLEIDGCTLPTGVLTPVAGTVFDLNQARRIGDLLDSPLLEKTKGFDHCYCLHNGGSLQFFGEFADLQSGRKMRCATNQPGVQFYTGNFLEGCIGRSGVPYAKHAGFCVETQQYPDAPNQPGFPSSILQAGRRYDAVTKFSFSW